MTGSPARSRTQLRRRSPLRARTIDRDSRAGSGATRHFPLGFTGSRTRVRGFFLLVLPPDADPLTAFATANCPAHSVPHLVLPVEAGLDAEVGAHQGAYYGEGRAHRSDRRRGGDVVPEDDHRHRVHERDHHDGGQDEEETPRLGRLWRVRALIPLIVFPRALSYVPRFRPVHFVLWRPPALYGRPVVALGISHAQVSGPPSPHGLRTPSGESCSV